MYWIGIGERFISCEIYVVQHFELQREIFTYLKQIMIINNE